MRWLGGRQCLMRTGGWTQNPDCGSPIQLPHPTIGATGPSQAAWPRDGWKRSFLCFYCSHIYAYSNDDVRHRLEATRNPYELKLHATFSIQFDCAEENCGVPIKIYAVVDASTTTEEIGGSFRGWSFQYGCPGHEEDHAPKPPALAQIEIFRCLFPS